MSETPRQIAAQAAWKKAYEQHRIAIGDRRKTAKKLSEAALEVVAADVEAMKTDETKAPARQANGWSAQA